MKGFDIVFCYIQILCEIIIFGWSPYLNLSFSWLWVVQLSEIWRDQSISFFSYVNSKLVEEPYIYGIFPETWKISKVGEISFRMDIFQGFIKNTFPILTQTSMFVLASPYSDAGEKNIKRRRCRIQSHRY